MKLFGREINLSFGSGRGLDFRGPVGGPQAPDANVKSASADTTNDIGWSYANIYAGKDFPKYNPDDLMSRRGYKIYKKMMQDEQVKAVVRFKRDAITSRAWMFDSEYEELSDDENALRIKVFGEAINQMAGSFYDAINGIMSAMYMGFSLTEKIYKLNVVDGKQWMGIDHMRLKPPESFYFYLDPYGTVIRVTQRMYGQEQDIDLDKFIHFVQNPEWDEQYGRSELRECYRAYFSKDMIIKFQNIHLERFAGGFIWAQPAAGKSLNPQSPEYANLQASLTNIHTKSSMIVPSGIDINVVEGATTDMYLLTIAQCDKAIAKSLLVPNLLGISEQGQHGSLAQADTQLEAFLWTLEADTARLEDILNDKLFAELGDLNWGDGMYPKLKFAPISEKSKMTLLKTWTDLVTAGAVQASDTDEEAVRDMLEMPDKGKPLTPQAPLALAGGPAIKDTGQVGPDGKPLPLGPDGKPVAPAAPIVGKKAPAVQEHTVVGTSQATIAAMRALLAAADTTLIDEEGGNAVVGTAEAAYLDQAVAAQSASDAAEADGSVENHIAAAHAHEQAAQGARAAGMRTVSEIHDALATHHGNAAVHKAKTVTGATEIENDPNNPTKQMAKLVPQAAFDRAMKRVDFAVIARQSDDSAHTTSYDIALVNSDAVKRMTTGLDNITLADVKNIGFTRSELGKMKDAVISGLKDSWKIGVDHARRELAKASRQKKFALDDRALQDQAAAFLAARGFTITGNISNATAATIQSIIMEGIKTSKTGAEMQQQIYKQLESEGMLTDQAVEDILGTTTVKNTAARISTIVRTSSFEAINEARYQTFSDPALDGFVEALEYSAIMDDRTTEICSDLNGDIYPIDDEIWATFTPPNHYNCRSLLIPVTQRDTWTASEPPTVSPQKGFGFARPTCNHDHQ